MLQDKSQGETMLLAIIRVPRSSSGLVLRHRVAEDCGVINQLLLRVIVFKLDGTGDFELSSDVEVKHCAGSRLSHTRSDGCLHNPQHFLKLQHLPTPTTHHANVDRHILHTGLSAACRIKSRKMSTICEHRSRVRRVVERPGAVEAEESY
jgi:hypothetical protein